MSDEEFNIIKEKHIALCGFYNERPFEESIIEILEDTFSILKVDEYLNKLKSFN